MRNKLRNANELFRWEFKLHVSCVLLKFINKFLRRCTKNIVYLVYLIKLVLPREEWEQ